MGPPPAFLLSLLFSIEASADGYQWDGSGLRGRNGPEAWAVTRNDACAGKLVKLRARHYLPVLSLVRAQVVTLASLVTRGGV